MLPGDSNDRGRKADDSDDVMVKTLVLVVATG